MALTVIPHSVRCGCTGEAVLADLASAAKQIHGDRDVLTRSGKGECTSVGRCQDERDSVGGLLNPATYHQLAPDLPRLYARHPHTAFLHRDQVVGHVPIELVPGGCDLFGDGIAQHVDDRREEVLADDGVLLSDGPERGVLVRDPRKELVRGVRAIGDEHRRVCRYRAR
jgi:hypothetical protein